MSLANKLAKTHKVIQKSHKTSADELSEKELAEYQNKNNTEGTEGFKRERARLLLALQEEKVVQAKAHNDNIKQDRELRANYADKAYRFVWVWSGVLFTLLFLSGAKNIFGFEFELSDTVLIALISGVTVNILGVFLSVMNNLFPRKSPATNNVKNNTRKTTGKTPLNKQNPA